MEAGVIARVLVGINLPDKEGFFRGLLDLLDADMDEPRHRDLAIATTGLLMHMGNLPWEVIVRTIKGLSTCDDERLQDSRCGVAVINGSVLLVPVESDFHFYRVTDLRRIEQPPEALMTSVYSVSGIWKRIGEVLGS